MTRSIAMGLLLATPFLVSVAPAYAQRWGREATPRSGVCFYQDINYGGRYFCSATGLSVGEVPSGTNDEISSIRIFGDAGVTVYRDPDLRGQSRFINSSISDLRSFGFNDRISSYEVDAYRAGSSRGASSRAIPRAGNVPFGQTMRQSNASRWTYRDAETAVRRSYRSVLGREPEPSGLRSWTEEVINNNWTQQDLEYALRQSDEYRRLGQGDNGRPRGARRR
jgi:hypothetical protein